MSKYVFTVLPPHELFSIKPCARIKGGAQKAGQAPRGMAALLEPLIAPGGVFGGKSHFAEQKSFPCSFCARKTEGFLEKTDRGGRGGELAFPHTGLSKPLLTG